MEEEEQEPGVAEEGGVGGLKGVVARQICDASMLLVSMKPKTKFQSCVACDSLVSCAGQRNPDVKATYLGCLSGLP